MRCMSCNNIHPYVYPYLRDEKYYVHFNKSITMLCRGCHYTYTTELGGSCIGRLRKLIRREDE